MDEQSLTEEILNEDVFTESEMPKRKNRPSVSYLRRHGRRLRKTPRQKVQEIQEQRSERAKSVDKLFNAPIATTVREWVRNPNKYDIHEIDTIPKKIEDERVRKARRRAEEKGKVEEVERGVKFHGGTQGRFRPGDKKVKIGKYSDRTTMPHELGHAFDWGHGERFGHGFTSRIKKEEYSGDSYEGVPVSKLKEFRGIGPKTIKHLKDWRYQDVQEVLDGLRKGYDHLDVLNNRYEGIYDNIFQAIVNGPEIEPVDPETKRELNSIMDWLNKLSNRPKEWRTRKEERIAEFLRSAITQPRATKREFPKLWKVAKEEGILEEMGIKWR